MITLPATTLLLVLAGTYSVQTVAPPTEAAPSARDSAVARADTTGAVPQRDAMDLLNQYILKRRVEPELQLATRTGLQWALLPTFSYNPVYGAAFGVLMSGAGRRGSTRARYSNLSISANYSTQSQVQVQVRGDVFSPGENYLMKVDFRYLDTERSTWGLGPLDTQQGEFPMSFLLNRIYATVLRHVSGPVYLGIGIHFDRFDDIVDELAEQGESTPYLAYNDGLPSTTRAGGASIDLLADTRDNLVNPKSGYYLNWSFRDYLTGLGSDDAWQELWIEARVYPHVPKGSRHVLAFWLYGWMTYGQAPYLDLPANGWDTYGRGARGYLAGRIRGTDQIYIESEYRWAITRDGLWGAVLFANGTSTTTENKTFGPMDYAIGTGLRLKFNKHNDTNLTLDYGWGRQSSHGFFLGMSEVF
jgi:hypothetical protein